MATILSYPYSGDGITAPASQFDTAGGGQGDFAQAYQSFSFEDGASVTDVHWTGILFSSLEAHTATFKVAFFSNVAGAPGVQLATQTFTQVQASETLIATPAANRFVYTYSAVFSSPFTAVAGTTYWLLIQANMTFPPQWGWASDGAGSSYQVFFGVPTTNAFNLALDLTGEVTPPACEPSSATEILEDGPRNTVLVFTGEVCGTDLDETVVVNAQNQYIDPVGDRVAGYRVDRIDYEISDGITINLYWGGVPTSFAHLSGRGMFLAGPNFGGFQNNESLLVRDGRILADSTGYSGSDELGFTIVMWLVKQSFDAIITPSFYLLEDGSGVYLMEDGNKYLLE